MSAGAPWSVKGIDPRTREIAKDLARRSGMTLGEWLNHMITSGEGEDEVVTPLARRAGEYRGPDRRSRARRLEDAYHDDDPDDLTRVTRALEDLSARIESAERRSTLAVSGIDQAVAGLLTRLETTEREQSTQARRLEDFAEDRREDLDRLRRMEREVSGPRSVEALRALEGALGKIANQIVETETRTRAQLSEVQGGLAANERRVERLESRPEGLDPAVVVEQVVSRVAERLERAEAQTSTAMRQLETSFAHLDERLRGAEGRLESNKLEKLANDLSQRVADARIELIQRFDTVSGNRFDKVERALSDLAVHVQQAETRSAQAIEKLGQEVLHIAQNLNGRMNQVEKSGEAVAERVSDDMARIAEAMESRLRKADETQAQVLERLGGEIARISEKLGERIVQSERRSALTAEDLGERVGRMADKLEARYDRASGELAERIRASEERTARLLEEARATLDRIHGGRAAPSPEPVPAPVAAVATPAEPEPEPEPPFPTAFGAAAFMKPAEGAADHHEFSYDQGQAESPPYEPPAATHASPFEAPASQASQEFDEFDANTEFVPSGTFAQAAPRPAVSTKEAIDAARAAARLGARNAGPAEDKSSGFALAGLKLGAKKRLQDRLAKEKKRETSTAKKALLASAVAVTSVTLVVGAYQFVQEEQATRPGMGKGALALEQAPSIAAVAITPEGGLPGGAQAETAYQEAMEKLEAGADDAIRALSNAANLGSPAAQFHLAKLYETGENGVAKDASEARRWTERAAVGGHPPAMHNLGLYYFDGTGGAKNPTVAAQWFVRAAEAGLVDSQYNLGRLYEQGFGVRRDPGEAYKWYLVAAASGDAGAQASADTLRETLTPQVRQAAETAAAAFQAASAEPGAPATAGR